MKISYMFLPISIYCSGGWRIFIPHDGMTIKFMSLPNSIYCSEGLADFNLSWWYEDILHVITHFNMLFRGVADFNPS